MHEVLPHHGCFGSLLGLFLIVLHSDLILVAAVLLDDGVGQVGVLGAYVADLEPATEMVK